MLDKFPARIRLLNKLYFAIFFFSILTYLESTSDADYGIYNDVTSIISNNQKNKVNHQIAYNQSDYSFRPSNWVGQDRLRAIRRLDNYYDKLRRYQEYKYRSRDEDYSTKPGSINNHQFKRRSDMDDDYYYSPSYYSPTSPYTAAHHFYPGTVQTPIISLPISSPVLPDSSPSYYRNKYRPAASRNYYHRIYPSSSTTNAIRRRLAAASTNSNYDPVPYYPPHTTSPSTPHTAYYYGNGLIPHHPQHVTYAQPAYAQPVSYPNTHGLVAHAAEQHDIHEGKEVHSLLPIITVIGIGAFMIPLLTTFFTAMLSSGTNCCQRQKERLNERPFDLRYNLYERAKDVWNQVENAINKEW